MAALDEAIENFNDFGWEDLLDDTTVEGPLAAGVHHLAQCAVGENDAAVCVQSGNTVRYGFEHGLELTATGFECSIGCAELHGRVLDCATAPFEIGSHVVKAVNQFAQLFGSALGYAVCIVSGSYGLHRVGQRFHRLGHLLGEVERQPTGGEERQAG